MNYPPQSAREHHGELGRPMPPSEHPTPAAVQHAEEVSFLWAHRHLLLASPRVTLLALGHYDERLEAHLDGLRVAAESGADRIPQIDDDDIGALFAPALLALEVRDCERIDALLAQAEATPKLATGLVGALEWGSFPALQGTAKDLLTHASPIHRAMGIACCAMHGVDPGAVLDAAIHDPDAGLRGRALRAAGQLGRRSSMAACMTAMLGDEDAGCRFGAAWSAVLLGDRDRALNALVQMVLEGGSDRDEALRAVITAELRRAHELLQQLSRDPQQRRLLFIGTGIAGEPAYVPWLIRQMEHPAHARLAGSAFTTITGVDLSDTGLEGCPPVDFESGPNDDPEDEHVDMDPDEELPWPDVKKVEQWWGANGSRFQKGRRYFMGTPVTRGHCVHVMKNGHQRQRVLAAHYLCLLDPGTPLFNTSAPAWRQQRLLARMQ